MEVDAFWKIVDLSRAKLQKSQIARLRKALRALDPPEVDSFCSCFYEAFNALETRKIWGAGILLNGGACSDDGFEYFREWLISQGRAVVEATLENPDSLAFVELAGSGVPSAEFEGFGFLAVDIYQKATGVWLENRVVHSEEDFGDYSNEQLARDLPRLWHKYHGHKEKFDLEAAQFRKPVESEVELEGFGKIAVGDAMAHVKFGRGIVESVELTGNMAICKIRFGDMPKWLTIQKGCAFLARE